MPREQNTRANFTAAQKRNRSGAKLCHTSQTQIPSPLLFRSLSSIRTRFMTVTLPFTLRCLYCPVYRYRPAANRSWRDLQSGRESVYRKARSLRLFEGAVASSRHALSFLLRGEGNPHKKNHHCVLTQARACNAAKVIPEYLRGEIYFSGSNPRRMLSRRAIWRTRYNLAPLFCARDTI